MDWKVILEGLYKRGKIDTTRLESAVLNGLITEAEKKEITQQ